MNIMLDVPNHGWLLDRMKSNCLGRTTVFPQQTSSPFLIELLVPVHSGFIFIHKVWVKMMESFPILFVSGVRIVDITSFLQTQGCQDIFKVSREVGWRIIFVVQCQKGLQGLDV